jgi:hypothetical protein
MTGVRNLGPAGTFTTVFWRYLLNFDSDINSGNIDRNLQNLGDIALYVWLGTCNLTSKDKSRFISLSSQNSETIDHIIRTLLEFKRYHPGIN